MKFFFLSVILSGMVISLHSQQLNDSASYNSGIVMIRDARTANDYKQAAAYFETLSSKNPSHWLSSYYAALSYIQASHQVTGDKERDAMLDKAQPHIDRAGKLNPGESEIMVIQAFLYQSRIQVNPQFRGMSYSSKAEASLKKATEANNKNPRAWSLMGYNFYYTPALFGGGPEKALPFFLKANDKFQTFKPLFPFYPRWGEKENKQMIAECKKSVK
jgi:tetratricopeptide (TPR) repeat protein